MKPFFSFLFLAIIQSLWSQSGIVINQHLHHKLFYNPAYAGAADHLDISALYRSQFVDMPGRPQQYMIGGSTPIGATMHNVGVNLNLDQVGIQNHYNLYANYAYRVKLTDNQKLQIGFRGGIDILSFNVNELDAFRAGDPAFQQAFLQIINPVVGAGLYYESRSTALTFALPNFLKNINNENGLAYFENNLNMIAGGEYVYALTKDFDIKPSAFVRYNHGSSTNFDLQLHMIFAKILWLGGGYRSSNLWMLGTSVDVGRLVSKAQETQVRVGYSYEISNSQYASFSGQSHELFLRITFAKSPKEMFSASPRFF